MKPFQQYQAFAYRRFQWAGMGRFLTAGLFSALVLVASSCREIITTPPDLPPNPFATEGGGGGSTAEVDSNSFLGLHTHVFSKSCAQPGCHDGSFEPDFRTIESAYRTLVYHPVEKNTPDERFTFRVVPADRTESWLWERVTTDDAVLGRMPLYDTLTPGELKAIRQWIDAGAPDVLGVEAGALNVPPIAVGWEVIDAADTSIEYQDFRPTSNSSIPLPRDTEVDFYFAIYDYQLNGDVIWETVLTDPTLYISESPYDFSAATVIDMDVLPAGNPHWGNPLYSASEIPFLYGIRLNTSSFVTDRTYFVRVSADDGAQTSPNIWPDDGTPSYVITKMSFVVP